MSAVDKLAKKLKDRDLADKLVKAGLRNPAMLRKASDQDLEAAVGKGGKGKVRERIR